MLRLVPDQEGVKDLDYAIVAVNAFANPTLVGEIRIGEVSPPLPKGDQQAFEDINEAMLALRQRAAGGDEGVLRASNVVPLIAAQVTEIVGGGITGRRRRRAAGHLLHDVLASAHSFSGQEPYRYDSTLPHDLPPYLEHFARQDRVDFGRLARSAVEAAAA